MCNRKLGFAALFPGVLTGNDVTRSAKKMERGDGATGSHVTPKEVPSGARMRNQKLGSQPFVGCFWICCVVLQVFLLLLRVHFIP